MFPQLSWQFVCQKLIRCAPNTNTRPTHFLSLAGSVLRLAGTNALPTGPRLPPRARDLPLPAPLPAAVCGCSSRGASSSELAEPASSAAGPACWGAASEADSRAGVVGAGAGCRGATQRWKASAVTCCLTYTWARSCRVRVQCRRTNLHNTCLLARLACARVLLAGTDNWRGRL